MNLNDVNVPVTLAVAPETANWNIIVIVMFDLIANTFNFFTTPSGSLIYHLVLLFSVIWALASAYLLWKSSEFPQARRTMFGLALLFIARIALFAVTLAGNGGLVNFSVVLPPLDRAITLFSLVWVIWLWNFPEPSRAADAITGLASVLLIAALGLSLVAYAQDFTRPDYNRTTNDGIWQLASIATASFGLLLLAIRRPNGAVYGLAFLILAIAGHVIYVVLGRFDGNFPGAVRLMYIAAFPLLTTLPQRFPAPSKGPISVKLHAPVDERRRYSTDPKTFHALLALAGESSVDRLSQAITRAIAQTMLADLCFLIYLTDNKNQIQVASGYDLIREENLDGGSLNKSMIPMLTNALQRGRPLRLPSSSTSADIKGLSDLLGLASPGHILSVPIVTPEKDSLGGVLLLSPYSNRLWSAEDQAFLSNIAVALVPIIQRGNKMTSLEQKGEQTRQALDVAQDRILELERRNEDLLKQMEAVRADAAQGLSQAEDLAALTRMQEDSQKAIERLKQENETLRSGKGHVGASQQVEGELRLTLEEIARLQNQLAGANMRVAELEMGSATIARPSEQAEVVASISQELRQPMSSIVGYTDLLLGESVGILGALQRKFVERIKASTERIGNLVDDLIQVTTLETGLNELKPEAVDLNLIIDNAMSYTSSQVREKNISLHLDLPKNMAPIHADREALQQIVIHLLQNAGSASPVEGSIHLRVQTKSEGGDEYVLIQVKDSGGGIPSEDLSRVFTRLYRADNVLIQGVGDTGVGLSIAKTLTEAQRGRIWVETDAGVGSTFSVLLPIAKNILSRVPEI
ncbi:MAG: GAF domain-containing protein [Anaerolineae bacterium]|nr:GAF domain-containing protein [Anaerolineae bacterium]MBL8104615.1 GAF domain-containing protein [Anaerolineales bacterium]